MHCSWQPTHSAAHEALERFLPEAGSHYARERNHDYGPGQRDNVSGLSPWLRHRLLLEQDVVRAAVIRHGAGAAEKFVQEVYWRTYFKGWMEQHPHTWVAWLEQLRDDQARLDLDRALRGRYVQAVSARTGIDCFDAWAQELVQSGYLHNHARMWFASIWVFTLQLPWSLGAAYFYEHLLDADPASNTLSWRWVVGLHTRGKHYLARPENIAKYTGGRFNPVGQLNTSAEALVEQDDKRPQRIALAPPSPPPQAKARVGLLITVEDCSPQSLALASAPLAIAALPRSAIAPFEPLRGPAQGAFSEGAIAEGMTQGAAHFACPASAFQSADWSKELVAWAREHALEGIATAYAPVGPTRTALEALASTLASEGISLHRLRRDYDSLAWPHAKAGFFGLKKQIPALLDALPA